MDNNLFSDAHEVFVNVSSIVLAPFAIAVILSKKASEIAANEVHSFLNKLEQ